MRKLFYCIVYTIAIGALSSCDSFGNKKSNQEDSITRTVTSAGSTPTPQKIKDKIAEQDTLMRVLASKIDSLSQVQSHIQEGNEELNARVTKLESTKNNWNYITLASLTIAIIAFILSLVNLLKLKKEINKTKADEDFSNDTNKKQKEVEVLKKEVNQLKHELNNNVVPNINKSVKNLEVRLQNLDDKLSGKKTSEFLDRPNSTTTNGHEQPPQPAKSEFQKVGYAKIDTENYFTTIYDSNQEGCVFKITFTSPTRGKFNLISLESLKSKNDWQEKVECSGISIKDATSFRVEEDGICEKIDEQTWEVIQPLKIKLLK